jgi:hypothetical protein
VHSCSFTDMPVAVICKGSEVHTFISVEYIHLPSVMMLKYYIIWDSSFNSCHVKYFIRLIRILK